MAPVDRIAISPNGNVYVGYEDMVACYTLVGGSYIFKQAQLTEGPVKLLAATNTKVLVYVSGKCVNVKESSLTKEELFWIENIEVPLELHTTEKHCLIVSDSYYTILSYEPLSGVTTICLPNNSAHVRTFYENSDGLPVLCVRTPHTEEDNVNVLEFRGKEENHYFLKAAFDCSAMGASTDGKKLALSSPDGKEICVYNTTNQECLYKLHKSRTASEIYNITFCGLNDKLVVTSSSKTIHIFRARDRAYRENIDTSFATCQLSSEKTRSKCHLIIDGLNAVRLVVVATANSISVYKYKTGVVACEMVSEEKLVRPSTPSRKISTYNKRAIKYVKHENPRETACTTGHAFENPDMDGFVFVK